MTKEYIILKETKLTNNCPECYSKDGMVLTFKQEKQQSKLFIKTKSTVIDHIQCQKCETTIFPGIWTEDIERVYSYHKKTISPQSSSIKFKGLFYGLLIVVLLLITATYIYINQPELLGL